jgi:putative acetyltransferase
MGVRLSRKVSFLEGVDFAALSGRHLRGISSGKPAGTADAKIGLRQAKRDIEVSFRIIEDNLTSVEIIALLQLHLDEMHQWSPACSVHAMPVERLRQADVTFYSAWTSDGQLAACGAIKHLDARHGELKSMRADPDFRGRGAGRAVLLHLMAEACARGYTRLSLETGTSEPFLPARQLYQSHGFVECPPFADYVLDGFSLCMTREL